MYVLGGRSAGMHACVCVWWGGVEGRGEGEGRLEREEGCLGALCGHDFIATVPAESG